MQQQKYISVLICIWLVLSIKRSFKNLEPCMHMKQKLDQVTQNLPFIYILGWTLFGASHNINLNTLSFKCYLTPRLHQHRH